MLPRDGFPQLSGAQFFSFGPPPVGNGDLVVFWPVLSLGHLEKFRPRRKTPETQFPGARGPEMEGKKGYHSIRDGVPLLYREQLFFQSDPHWPEIAI